MSPGQANPEVRTGAVSTGFAPYFDRPAAGAGGILIHISPKETGNEWMIRPEFRQKKAGFGAFFSIISQIGSQAAQADALFLMTRAQIAGGLSPFAPACMAAGMTAGWSPAAMLMGCAAGAWMDAGRLEWTQLSPVIACLLLLALRQAEKKWTGIAEMKDFLTGAAAGLGLLIPGLITAGGLRYNLLTCLLNAAAAMFLAPALISGMQVKFSRKRLMPEEQLSLSLLMLSALIGLRGAPRAGKFLSQTAAALLTLLFSGAGSGMGALAGLASGTALTIGGSDPFMGAALGLCGLLCGCVRNVPRAGAGIAFLLGNMLTVSWGVGYTTGAVELWPAAAGCVLYCALPSGMIGRLCGWIRGGAAGSDPERIAGFMRRKAGLRLERLSEVFGELADGYGEESALPGEQQIISQVRHALCDGCEGYADCWMGDQAQAGRLMCRMAAEALAGKEITPARELPPDLIRHCRRSGQIDRRALPLLAQLAKRRRDELKRGEARSLMGRQFREAQRMLDALSTQLRGGACLSREYASLVQAALDRAGIAAKEITVILDDRLEIICLLKERLRDAEAHQRAARLLSDELGVPFSPVLTRGQAPEECELRMRQAPALTAAFSLASCAAEEGGECGDSALALLLPDGRLIAAVSDGMGHGAQAAAESRRCVTLLRKFVSAGVEREVALTAVNSLLLLREGEEMFATADLCVIDLYSGMASWSKLGACSSYILSERGIRVIRGGRLPLGIIDRVEPAAERMEVHPGDLIIMISDGIADELKSGQTEELKKMLAGTRHMKPEEAAQAVLGWAKARDAGRERDDMTVIAVRVLARRVRRG